MIKSQESIATHGIIAGTERQMPKILKRETVSLNCPRPKPFQSCPGCDGEGWESYRIPNGVAISWGSFQGARKCPVCSGFGLVSVSDMLEYLKGMV